MSPWYFFSFILFLLIGCNTNPKPVNDSRENDYALYDEKGMFHRFSRYNDSEAIVLWVQGNGCPIVRNALPDFKQLVAEYQPKGVTFFMINSNIQDTRHTIAAEAQSFNFTVPVLDDSAQLIADALDIRITSEAIVLHPVTREVLYRGPLSDRLDYEAQKKTLEHSYLADALDQVLEGKYPKDKRDMARGCTVTRLSDLHEEKSLTYTQDIAPILRENCMKCHHEAGIAPWAMTDYQTIVGWSAMIKQVLLSKRMPPWKADPHINEFQDSFALSDSNARKLMTWIDDGMPRGMGEDPLAGVSIPVKQWKKGAPDTIISLASEALPATGNIAYRYQKIPLRFQEDRWLKGIEIQPGNPKVLHHIVVTNTERHTISPITDREQRPWTDNYIALGGGADQATFYPEGTGVFLPKGTILTIQLHYTTTGKPETDITLLGLYFHHGTPEKEFYSLAPSNVELVIPPYEKEVHVQVSDSVNRDILIHHIVPHMHYRGRSIRFSVIDPNGKKRTLVSVPDFNFNWQWLYRLKQPEFVEKGSQILVEGIYDNSVQNPLNPDPSQEVRYGIQSTDEMLIGFFNFTLADEAVK